MQGLQHFSIQLKSLKNGVHHYHFQVGNSFFEKMESQSIKDANYDIEVDLERENKSIDITIKGSGNIQTVCDRCTASISLPVTFTSRVYAQINNNPNVDDLETYYYDEKEPILDLAPIVYNEISLHLPLVNVYDCEDEKPLPCDTATLDRLDIVDDTPDSESEESSSPWDALNDMNF